MIKTTRFVFRHLVGSGFKQVLERIAWLDDIDIVIVSMCSSKCPQCISAGHTDYYHYNEDVDLTVMQAYPAYSLKKYRPSDTTD